MSVVRNVCDSSVVICMVLYGVCGCVALCLCVWFVCTWVWFCDCVCGVVWSVVCVVTSLCVLLFMCLCVLKKHMCLPVLVRDLLCDAVWFAFCGMCLCGLFVTYCVVLYGLFALCCCDVCVSFLFWCDLWMLSSGVFFCVLCFVVVECVRFQVKYVCVIGL